MIFIVCCYRGGNNFEALFCSECSDKSAHYFPSNCFNKRLLFLNFSLPIFSQKFLFKKVTSLLVSTCMCKNIPFNFIFSLILMGIFIAFYPFYSSFIYTYHVKMVFLSFSNSQHLDDSFDQCMYCIRDSFGSNLVVSLNLVLLYLRMVARKEQKKFVKTKNTKARKNFNKCIENK